MSSKLEARQKQRQDEIITAARRCFRASGFHGASMSQIASEAQLSVGQIYRYFSNKDAIIEEMIRRIIDSRIGEMQGKTLVEGMPQALAWRQTLSEDDDALMLEMSAEATRNPQVATMLIEAEARMFANACVHLKNQFPHLSDEHIRCCVEITAVMIEGTIYRRLTPLQVPSEQLEPIYQSILDMLFSVK
ncbi:TetR/AcrR family transcriptional regulator [Cronobacter turicensis]|uniref:TetR/AcrR family transcriptional regulator n=2 Tax=Cronobacter turicensis TaxID=413502 RepID=A0A2T7B1F4_9ENTR|nr:helix-turn-helix domain-containing protein [Cronobacter turicensis]MEB8541089.1 helix-turn-helix domain containing protein [Cronobacter sakazakii]EGT4493989.1 TetR/AcrR family transcriptional regulator [Cronobacter turicensis]EKM0438953.1 TetR/AcrR family transcriptional regulator [Cronobacter turicensis]EKM0527746.1 TetR/AcrR family transcriptional regulator [Cronobacter turicensis]EKM0668396.1 TetR/AcrR family transcriptional regulator [Cronobacter turicensis]